jgi:tetratricopeptide (TPR) repeat protein
VELCRVGKKITAEMSSQELIVEATQKKESGNRYFKEKNYEQAAKLYKRSLKLLETWEHSDEDTAQCKELLIALGNNVGNVQHKLKQYKEARQSSLEVLQLDGKNVKAMYRVGQIALDQNEFDEANTFLRKALEVEPKNAKVRHLLVQLKRKKSDQKALERKLYAKLGGSKATDTAEAGKIAALVARVRQNPAILAAAVTVILAILMYVYIGKPKYEVSDDGNVSTDNESD